MDCDAVQSSQRRGAEVRFAIGELLNKYADRDNVYDVGEDKFKRPRSSSLIMRARPNECRRTYAHSI